MITTSEHYTDYVNATIEPKNNAIQEYVKVRGWNFNSRLLNVTVVLNHVT